MNNIPLFELRTEVGLLVKKLAMIGVKPINCGTLKAAEVIFGCYNHPPLSEVKLKTQSFSLTKTNLL